jgi:hypothetical protein
MRTDRTIRSCRVRMKVVCPKTWEALAETAAPGVRRCSVCAEDVYLCTTDEETLAHARANHCIAREIPHPSELPEMILGRPASPPVVTQEQARAKELWRRERAIDKVLAGRFDESRQCPSCGYPVQSFRETCYVCGHKLGRAD